MIRSFAKAATLLATVALLVGCEETKTAAGDAEAPKATPSASTVTTPTTATATVTATASASAAATPAATDAGAAEPKDAGHDSGAKPKK